MLTQCVDIGEAGERMGWIHDGILRLPAAWSTDACDLAISAKGHDDFSGGGSLIGVKVSR